jgi:hypothetical protein
VYDDPEGVKGAAAGLKGDLEREFGAALLFNKLDALSLLMQQMSQTYFSDSVTTVHSSNRSLSRETSKRDPLRVDTLSCLMPRVRSYTS